MKLAKGTKTHVDDLLLNIMQKTMPLFALVMSAYVGSLVLILSDGLSKALKSIALVVLLIQVAVWVHRLATALITQSITQRKDQDPAAASAFGVIGFFVRLVLWAVVVVVSLQNLGVKITALIAGLGVGGIAIALAAQNILGDIFNSVAILMDKPFEVGDYIIVGDHMGTVERIGIKTTRVRSLTGEELVFSNAELVGSRIRNYGRMQERRILFTVGVRYQTALEQLKAIPSIVREIVEAQPEVRFDRAHFKGYGAFSLDFEVVYYVLDRDYAKYMDTQQGINLALFERFEQEGIEFAYPTQTLYIGKEEAGGS
ncbi:MAG: mechanosensitive ion channel family protein [Verrucomicrobia bacterium]|nr:mechanosensitive ion channel family protein [Verrucomicrobiota bacterium]